MEISMKKRDLIFHKVTGAADVSDLDSDTDEIPPPGADDPDKSFACDRELISPYKRLRVDSLVRSSIDSQNDQKEANTSPQSHDDVDVTGQEGQMCIPDTRSSLVELSLDHATTATRTPDLLDNETFWESKVENTIAGSISPGVSTQDKSVEDNDRLQYAQAHYSSDDTHEACRRTEWRNKPNIDGINLEEDHFECRSEGIASGFPSMDGPTNDISSRSSSSSTAQKSEVSVSYRPDFQTLESREISFPFPADENEAASTSVERSVNVENSRQCQEEEPMSLQDMVSLSVENVHESQNLENETGSFNVLHSKLPETTMLSVPANKVSEFTDMGDSQPDTIRNHSMRSGNSIGIDSADIYVEMKSPIHSISIDAAAPQSRPLPVTMGKENLTVLPKLNNCVMKISTNDSGCSALGYASVSGSLLDALDSEMDGPDTQNVQKVSSKGILCTGVNTMNDHHQETSTTRAESSLCPDAAGAEREWMGHGHEFNVDILRPRQAFSWELIPNELNYQSRRDSRRRGQNYGKSGRLPMSCMSMDVGQRAWPWTTSSSQESCQSLNRPPDLEAEAGNYNVKENSYPFSSSLVINCRKARKSLLQSPGHLKLAVYMNAGLLTVYVKKARKLSSSWKRLCDSYVKISLAPDESKRTRCKTPLCPTNNSPIFDQKFSIEIMEEDKKKRLLISVWHRDTGTGTSEFLGCMSFGVRNLLQKDVDGWYYLLSEDVGRKKHLRVNALTKPALTSKGPTTVPQINIAVDGQEHIVITVPRGKNGFGFSFVGEMPPKVGRVDIDLPADKAGVKKGDAIIRINGQNVSRSTCEGVAHLVKKRNPKFLTLELLRQHTSSGEVDSSDLVDSYSKREIGTSTDHVYESIRDSPTASFEYQNENHHWKGSTETNEDDPIPIDDEPVGPNVLATITSTPFPVKVSAARTSNAQRKKHESIHRLMSMELGYIDFMRFGTERYSRPLRHCIISAAQHSVLFQNVEKILTISEYHIKQLQDNSTSLHSDFDDSQLGACNIFPKSPAFIYQPKIHMLCQAYQTYAYGLTHSNALLKELRRNQDFRTFIYDSSTESASAFQQPSINEFINKPIQHIHELYTVLGDILSATSTNSPDYAVLQQVVCQLAQCITAIFNMSSDGRVHSMESLTSSQGCSNSHTNSCKGSMVSLTSCSSADFDGNSIPASTTSKHSVDTEIANLQDLLVFPPDVPTFQLCHEDRHIIFQGQIFRCHQGSWYKSQLLLLSDLMLVLDPEPNGRLKVIQTPVYLSDLAGIEINRKHASEFILHLHETPTYSTLTHSLASNAESTKLVFRAPSLQEKFMWKSLIEQHVSAVLGKKLQYYGSMQDISNIKTSVVL